MSFFDEVETTVANTRFLQAVEDSGPVKLSLQPFEELGQLSAVLQGDVTLPHLLKPKTMGLYLFKQFLKEPLKERSVKVIDRQVFLAFLEEVEEFAAAKTHERATKGKAIYDTYLKYGGSRQAAAAAGLATMVLSTPEAEYDEDEGPEASQALREYDDDDEGSVRRQSRSATTQLELKNSDLKKQDSGTGVKQADVHLHLGRSDQSTTKRPSAANSIPPTTSSTTPTDTPTLTPTASPTANMPGMSALNFALPSNATTSSCTSTTPTKTSTSATTSTNTPATIASVLSQAPPPPPPPPPEPSSPPQTEAATTGSGQPEVAKKGDVTVASQDEKSRVVTPEYSQSDMPPPSSSSPTSNALSSDSSASSSASSSSSVNVPGTKTPPPPPPLPSADNIPASTDTYNALATSINTSDASTVATTTLTTTAAVNTTTAIDTNTATGATSTPATTTTTDTTATDTTGDRSSGVVLVTSATAPPETKESVVSVKIETINTDPNSPRVTEMKVSVEEMTGEPSLRTRLGSVDRPMDEMSFGLLAELVKRIDKMDAVLNDLVRYLSMKPPPTESFNMIIDAFARILQTDKLLDDFIASPQWRRYVQLRAYVKKRMTLDHFRVFRVLGRGAFGAVSAVQKIDTHAIFAMKEMAKRQVKHQQSEWVCVNERKVLSKMKSPFVLNLKYSFHNSENMYLIFDMCSGGDLKFHLRNEKMRCFSLERARFYAAEVLLGLEHIHSLNIVYRDLKPTNILLDEEGHCVISDLGLTVHLKKNKLIKHLAGTAGYWAPEILQKAGTYKTSDYWSFGVMLYEMILGRRPACKCSKKDPQWCPFGQSRSMEQFALKEDGVLILDVDYPRELPSDAVDLLKKLFEPNPEKRIGVNGAAEIKAHPFFKLVDWAKLENKEITPPFKPDSHTVNANSIGEVGETNKAKYRKIKLLDEDEKHYEDFDFVNMEALEAEMVTALIKMDAPPAPAKDTPKGSSNGGTCCVVS